MSLGSERGKKGNCRKEGEKQAWSLEKENSGKVGKTAEKSEKRGREGLQSETSDSSTVPILMVDVVELGGDSAANARPVTECVAVSGAL